MTPEKQLKVLQERYGKYVQYWDCYNDCPIEDNDDIRELITTYCNDMIREYRLFVDETYPGLIHWKEVKKLAKKL